MELKDFVKIVLQANPSQDINFDVFLDNRTRVSLYDTGNRVRFTVKSRDGKWYQFWKWFN